MASVVIIQWRQSPCGLGAVVVSRGVVRVVTSVVVVVVRCSLSWPSHPVSVVVVAAGGVAIACCCGNRAGRVTGRVSNLGVSIRSPARLTASTVTSDEPEEGEPAAEEGEPAAGAGGRAVQAAVAARRGCRPSERLRPTVEGAPAGSGTSERVSVVVAVDAAVRSPARRYGEHGVEPEGSGAGRLD